MGNEKETIVVKEQAIEREQKIIRSIENLRQETSGNDSLQTTPLVEILNQPQHRAQTTPIIPAFNNNHIINEGGKKSSTDDSKMWKEETDKRIQKKSRK